MLGTLKFTYGKVEPSKRLNKLPLIDLNAYNNNIVKIIVIIVPNVIIINSFCLIHAIIMIKCLFCTTGITIIWYMHVCVHVKLYQ